MLSISKRNQIFKPFVRLGSSFSYKNLPEESKRAIDRIIRVDHAGKYGINNILI